MGSIADRFLDFSRIAKDAHVVAVTKGRSIDDINEVIDAGARILGENRVQEAESKLPALRDVLRQKNIEIHMIGHLQKNKARKAVELFDLIQSVDSLELALELDKRASGFGKVQDILLQVNIGEEGQKSGFPRHAVLSAAKDIMKLKSLRVRGLMAIAPIAEEPEHARPFFRDMRNIFMHVKALRPDQIDTLSMGMTDDYLIALEEGSTMVRIGTGIFGHRKQ